jgi:hypothetical protein
MTKLEAIDEATKLASHNGAPYGVWVTGPGRYVVDRYQEGDLQREGLCGVVNPPQLFEMEDER